MQLSSNKHSQPNEEMQELLLQQLEHLFDRPCLKAVSETPHPPEQIAGRLTTAVQTQQQLQQQQPQYKLVYEKDFNTFLITNPLAIFKVLNKKQFLSLNEPSQVLILDKLDEILQKFPQNAHILTDHILNSNAIRQNLQMIQEMKPKQKEDDDKLQMEFIQSIVNETEENDVLMLAIQLCMKLSGKNNKTVKKMIEFIKKITSGKRFFKCHLEFIYQYLKLKTAKYESNNKNNISLEKIDTAIKILLAIFEQRFEFGPTNYFYFSGFLSGIQVSTKNIQSWPFVKGFAAGIWFQIQENNFQDNKNLPVLFNCFSQGFGGFECYFNKKKLFYRILQRNYTLPTSESNGIQIGEEFQPKKWYFLGIEHDKPYLARAQLTAVINDKVKIANLPMDYPKIEKGAKLSMITICKNFVGQMSSFILFREQLNNTKKFIQMYTQNEHGFFSNQQIKQINQEIFDQKLNQKFLLFYCPERTHHKIVYDCIDLSDGELMINSGVCNSAAKSKLFFTGGLNSLLPILEQIKLIVNNANKNLLATHKNLDNLINEYLKLVNSIISTKSYSNNEAENSHFFQILFHLLSQLPKSSVNSQTIQLLAEIRFQIGDSQLQEQFFNSLLFSSDFWINTQNFEVINEFWSFVKAIYSQNPVYYNKIFSIQNLIDLMIRISDIKDGHCCEYHKNTSIMFYSGQANISIQLDIQNKQKDRSQTQVNQQNRSSYLQPRSTKQFTKNTNQLIDKQNDQLSISKIYQIDQYLVPIAGVLEGVLTSGGNDILDQIQYVAKSLTIKSSPCFHLQMLKLLKVLLLDSKEDRHCASPFDFASNFINANGLQILLYLCSNSSFDVKSMCIKLIDVLSSHTSLIKMRIDTDLITYMCSIILPKQIIDGSSLNQTGQIFTRTSHNRLISSEMDTGTPLNANQYEMIEEDEYKENDEASKQHEEDYLISQNKEFDSNPKQNLSQQFYQINQTIELNSSVSSKGQQNNDNLRNKFIENNSFVQQNLPPQKKKQQKFGEGLFMEEDDDEEQSRKEEVQSFQTQIKDTSSEADLLSELIPSHKRGYHHGKDKNFSVGNKEDLSSFIDSDGSNLIKSEFSNDFQIISKKQTKTIQKESNNNKKNILNQTGKVNMFSKGLSLAIQEAEEETKSNEDDDDQFSQFQDKKKFMQTQKIPISSSKDTGKNNFQKSRGLALNIIDDQEIKRPAGPKKQIMFAEIQEDSKEQKTYNDDDDDETNFGNNNKSKFANENVMSKSNLRQPKSFNFGFPADDDDDEQEELKAQNYKSIQQKDTQQAVKDDQEIDMILPQNKNFSTKNLQGKNKILLIQKNEFKSQHVRGKSQNKPQTIIEDLNFEEADQMEENKNDQNSQNQNFMKQDQELLFEGTTGATNETNYDTSYSSGQKKNKKAMISFKQKAKLFTNQNQQLNIDTDAINELFTYGGEKGEVKQTEDQENGNFEQEIDELASVCLAYMNRQNKDEQIIQAAKTTFEQKYLDDNKNPNKQQNEKDETFKQNQKKQFMTPQSVRGIKKIEFQLSQQEKEKIKEKEKRNQGGLQGIGNKTGNFTYQTIVEEASPMATSKSSSSKREFNFGGSNTYNNLNLTNNSEFLNTKEQNFNITGEDLIKKDEYGYQKNPSQIEKIGDNQASLEEIIIPQSPSGTNNNSDEYTLELENLYTSCLEWILSRAPSSLYQNIVVDDFDKINNTPALSLLMTLVTYSNNLLRQKALQDLYMLARWDPHNGSLILFHPQFHFWLLELLMPYQDLASSYSNLSGPALAVYDIGCKLHTLLLKNSCCNKDEETYKKLNYFVRWPEIIGLQNNQRNKLRIQRDIETANRLTRVLLQNLLMSLKEDSQRQRPQISEQYTTWKNIVHATYLVEELLLSSNQKDLNSDQLQFEINRDLNVSVMRWIQRDYLFYYNGSNDRSLWAEWDVLEALFQTIDTLYSEQFFNKGKTKGQSMQTIEENVFTLLEKSSADDFTQDIEMLMYEGKGNSLQALQNMVNQANNNNPQEKSRKSKAKVNILSLAAQALNIQHNSQAQQQNQQNSTLQNQLQQDQTFLKTILNLLCITLTQADTKQLVQLWLDRFERYVKFLMIVSETWRSRHIQQYNFVQKNFQEAITFALTFIFHEIHLTNRNPQQQLQQSSNSSNFSVNTQQSPKEQSFGKIFAHSLKNLMIYFINIIEYSKIRFTPSQLETQIHLSACRGIFQNILIKSYSQGQIENLISFKDISRYKTSDYDDFPESFYMDDWKDTFFNNEQIKQIVKKQIDYKLIENYYLKKKTYSIHSIELNGRTDKTKDEILKRMQNDTLDVISKLSEEEFARKNKVALINENINREQKYFWKKTRKILFNCKGIWEDLEMEFLKQTLCRSAEGIKGYMIDRKSNGFEYIKNDKKLEGKIFLELVQQDNNQTEVQNNLGSQIAENKSTVISQSIKNKKKQGDDDDDEEDSQEEDDEDEIILDSEFLKNSIEPQELQLTFFSKELTTRERLALKRSYILHLKEHLFLSLQKGKEIISELKCSILKPFYQRPGLISLTSNEIIFFDDLYTPSNQQEIQNIFFFKYEKPSNSLLYKIIPLQNLKEVQRRRFLGRKSALEIFMMDNSSMLLNFTSMEDRDQFAKKILRKRNQKCQNLKYYETLDPKRILKKRELTEKWMQWKISNFEYLMHLNNLAGRSYNDLSQYPVVPWILTDYQSLNPPDLSLTNQLYGGAAPSGYRDLNKNMQLLGSAERQAIFKSKYEDSDSFISMNDKFHCGSHYSNPGIVLHYLCRLSPYIDAYVELHGKSLDKPDRTFYSINDSLQSALTDHSDIRELIPEFYYSPEMFLNQNKINFGVRQDDKVVSDVILPNWSHNNPHLFGKFIALLLMLIIVIFMREAMESAYVSNNLAGWIDYIFGYKQRDLDAERSLNTFSMVSYEDGIDLDTIQDDMLKASYQNQIYNFGQTPSQLFPKNQKHPSKLPRNQVIKFSYAIDLQSKIKVYKPVAQQQQIQQKSQGNQQQNPLICPEAILKARFIDEQTIIGISRDGTLTYFIWLSRAHELNPQTPFTCCEDKKKKFDPRTRTAGIDLYDRSIKKFEFPIVILTQQNARFIIRGGFWDGKITICPMDGQNSEQVISLYVHQSTVTCIATTSSERTIISGSKLGDIVVWANNTGLTSGQEGQPKDSQQWQVVKHICDHEGQISSIFINEEMGMFVTASYDGSVNMYNLWNQKLIRTFKHPLLAPIYSAIITQTPLLACCFYSREDHMWHSFSINGTFLEKQKEECGHIVSPLVSKDSSFMDKLVYGTEKGYIIMRSLPLLKPIKKLQVSNKYPVLSIIISPEKKFLLVGCGDGGLNVITEPSQQNQAPQNQGKQQTNNQQITF